MSVHVAFRTDAIMRFLRVTGGASYHRHFDMLDDHDFFFDLDSFNDLFLDDLINKFFYSFYFDNLDWDLLYFFDHLNFFGRDFNFFYNLFENWVEVRLGFLSFEGKLHLG